MSKKIDEAKKAQVARALEASDFQLQDLLACRNGFEAAGLSKVAAYNAMMQIYNAKFAQ